MLVPRRAPNRTIRLPNWRGSSARASQLPITTATLKAGPLSISLPATSTGQPRIATRNRANQPKPIMMRPTSATRRRSTADLLPTFRPGAPSYDDAHEPPARSLNGARDYALPERARFPDEQQPVQSVGRQPPGFLSQLPDDRDYDYPPEQGADDQAYALEDYEEEVPAGRRRTGLVVGAAVLGLAVLGTAGAFAYRAMFGSSMPPSLPPIIKADDGPNKIVPNKPKSNASDQADASATSGEKLVSREEQPVDVPAPANSGPRVVSTIPIFPIRIPVRPAFRVLRKGPRWVRAERLSRRPLRHPQHRCKQTLRQPRRPGPYGRQPRAPRLHPRRHVVGWAGRDAIAHAEKGSHGHHPTRSDGVDDGRCLDRAGDALSCASPGTRPDCASCRYAAGAAGARAASRGQWPAVDRSQSGRRCAGPWTRPHCAGASGRAQSGGRAEPAPSAATGSYAVQVTSQRSEADAQAEFRTLRTKFPTQFGGREPIIRRSDPGAKGVYYRALVGPFASADQAAGMCSSLKAAGGSCIVQRN